MESAIWLNRTLIDIVFERRNKAYGAFDLRLRYERNMARAILLSIVFFVAAAFCFALWQNREKVETTTPAETGRVIEISAPKPIRQTPKPPAQLSAPQPIAPQTALVTPIVVDDDTEIVEVEIPTQETLANTTVGTTEIVGSGEGTSTTGNTGVPDDTGTGVLIEEPETTPAQLFEVDQKPTFPGGDEAMYKYLRDNLDYPPLARENKMSGTVVVRFVVNTNGRVEQVEIMKSPSAVFNAEALDVIGGMPTWTPAKRNGKAVATFYIIPLKFQLL